MKSTLLFFISICALSLTQAQDKSYKIIFGCTVNYLNSYLTHTDEQGIKTSNNSHHQVGLNPHIGLRLNDFWTVGLAFGMSHSRRSGYDDFFQEEFTNIYSSYNIGIFARRYFGTNKPVQFFLEPNLTFTAYEYNSTSKFILSAYVDSAKEFNCLIAPGISWAVSKRFNLIARFGKLGYVWGKSRNVLSSDYGEYSYLGLRLSTDSFFVGAELKL
ncbi:MAG: hypothetical protein IPM82_30700 [Saprospiraceae bacterium]|nr:hypothetical protein [Saprospiraceae bacterium]